MTDIRISYPEELPVSAHRAEIRTALSAGQVIIVSGDTGSGKTTQLPKMMLELGRGARGKRIAVTQPRRLAAVTMAERVADELAVPVGGLVGFRHRYAKSVSSETRVEFVTDGVLLAETRFDPLLRAYDTIIVDEAHERSLNIDFLLGILKRLLAKRRDLKIVIASATMDTSRFAAFFNAPVISVPGRLYPIDLRFREPEEDADLPESIAAALRELPNEGDVLVFLPGERDIREAAEYLNAVFGSTFEIIPLLASLPASEQRRAFRLSPGRRVILATNVAETSVTIPGIRAVIDSGLARISRYVHRTQVQRLQIEPISKASARQRAGRCGRLGPGVCIRLYSETDFASRDDYTAPEVLRSSLAGVILTMLDLNLGDIESFPFIDPPKPAMVHEGLKELLELGAIRSGYQLTEIGRKLARIPLEPRLARMLIAASENAMLPVTLPLVASLACDDPLRRPIDEKEKARAAHAKWRRPRSDFLSTRALWTWWQHETEALSQSKARKLAKANYLSWPKLREWCDLTRQLEALCKRLGLSFAQIPEGEKQREKETFYAALHMSLLSGLLGRIGRYHTEDKEYRGAHALRFVLHPGSVLAKPAKGSTFPPWIVSGELVDTTRLFAREAAEIDPSWIESIATDLVKHHVHSPFWDAASGFVRATERVTLYGLPIVDARKCDYARFKPEEARTIFLRLGLLTGEIAHPPPQLAETTTFLRKLREYAERRRDLSLFDEDRLLAYFDALIPKDITNANALKKWLSRATPAERTAFKLTKKDWWPDESTSSNDFPNKLRIDERTLPLTYRNTPDDPSRDGITCTAKESDLPALAKWRADWLVPGLLGKKVSYLLLSLPNSYQRLLKPIDESLVILLDILRKTPPKEPLERAIRRAILERWAFRIPEDIWKSVKLPPYLKIRFVIRRDSDDTIVYDGRDLPEIKAKPEKPKILDPNEAIKEAARRSGEDPKLAEREIRQIVKDTEEAERRFDLLLSTGVYPEETVDAVLEQLAFLTVKGYAYTVPLTILRRYARYLRAIEIRLQRAKISPSSDLSKEARFAPFWQTFRDAAKQRDRVDPAALSRYRWLLEEYRIQLFAPELKTHESVSPKRLDEIILFPEDI